MPLMAAMAAKAAMVAMVNQIERRTPAWKLATNITVIVRTLSL